MKILVLGAGVIGTTTAWYLAKAGHQISVVDRQPDVAMETSHANGGQISVSHAEPWANPHALPRIIKWLGRQDAPLHWHWRADPAQLAWGMRFLLECFPNRSRHNIAAIINLALHSRAALQTLRSEIPLNYALSQKGILHLYRAPDEFKHAAKTVSLMQSFGLDRRVVSAEECLAIEPALQHSRSQLAGGDYTPSDESGDASLFTKQLADHAKTLGVQFLLSSTIEKIVVGGTEIAGVVVQNEGQQNLIIADAYVVALGSYTPRLLSPLKIHLPICPAKGYSLTFPLSTEEIPFAPTVSLTDDDYKLVFSRLGNQLRVAGTAEFNGYNLELDAVRLDAIKQRVHEWFPHITSQPSPWCGLRPATPSNLPLIGACRYRNLFINSGHGTLGWTLACGSARSLARLINDEKPEISFPFLKPL